MAIGLGQILGFSFPENFRYPYESRSITEFWRRWHITLGSWFREYVYIPLGGSRVGKARLFRNLLLVWALTGLWHGAAWNFVLWGLWYAALLILEKFCYPKISSHLYVLLATVLGFVLFQAGSLAEVGHLYAGYLVSLFEQCSLAHRRSDRVYLPPPSSMGNAAQDPCAGILPGSRRNAAVAAVLYRLACGRLVQSIPVFSVLKGGRFAKTHTAFFLAWMLADTGDLISRFARSKNIFFRAAFPGAVSEAVCPDSHKRTVHGTV